jgi:hypothetical protein
MLGGVFLLLFFNLKNTMCIWMSKTNLTLQLEATLLLWMITLLNIMDEQSYPECNKVAGNYFLIFGDFVFRIIMWTNTSCILFFILLILGIISV